MQNLKVNKVHLVQTTDDLKKPGDYYTIENLHSIDEKRKPHPAIILKCPYCALDMASVPGMKIEYKKGLWSKIWGYKGKINVSSMLQCPYTHSHKFFIKKGKIVEA